MARLPVCVRISGSLRGCRAVTYRTTRVSELAGTCRPVSSVRLASSAASKMQVDLSGIYPPIATPFNNDETIAYDKLKENMDKWNKIPFKGYVVQGSNGEYVYLRDEERVELVQRAAEMAAGDKLIIAGAGCESTRDTIIMCEKMSKAGAHAVLVVTPCFYKGMMTSEALIQHYTKVADASPVPVILYSVPGNTGIDLAPEVVIQLSNHPNIVGVKDSGGDIAKIAYMVHKTKENNFQVLAGSASFLFSAYAVLRIEISPSGNETLELAPCSRLRNLSAGAVGGVLGLANVLGEHCCQLETLFKQSKMEEGKLLQHRLIGPNWAVTKRFGVPGLKCVMEMMGYYGGPNRSPLTTVSVQNQQILRQVFQDEGFL